MKKKLYLRLKYGACAVRIDYKLYQEDQEFVLYKNFSFSKKGKLDDLKNFLKKQYKVYYKNLQKQIAHLIGSPYISRYKIPNLTRYL